jgi:Family of unknown function (DUF6131)
VAAPIIMQGRRGLVLPSRSTNFDAVDEKGLREATHGMHCGNRYGVADPKRRENNLMIVLGIILILVGYLLPVPAIIATIGWVLLAIGVVLLILGQVDRPVAGRRYWY